MATGISPFLPLTIDANDGAYKLNKTLAQTVQQNLKMLILTIPGERVMDPLFGVGLSTFHFEPNTNTTYALIAEKIREQASKYMPFIDIIDIEIVGPFEQVVLLDNLDRNFVSISLEYKILPLDINDILSITEQID